MTPKVFLDTNVVFDLLSGRQPFWEPIAKLMTIAERGEVSTNVSALSFATIHYLLSKRVGSTQSKSKLLGLRQVCSVLDLTEETVDRSLASDFNDYEDALQYYSALKADCSVILSRDQKGYKLSSIPVLTPEEYLKRNY